MPPKRKGGSKSKGSKLKPMAKAKEKEPTPEPRDWAQNKLLNEQNLWLSISVEVVEEIFRHCHTVPGLFDLELPKRGSNRTTLPIEFVLSSVCVRWRAIALGIQALWKRFRFIPDHRSTYPPDVLELYNERSGGHLEDLYLDFGDASYNTDSIDFVNEIFVEHAETLRRYILIGGGQHELTSYFAYLFDDAETPNLEYLALHPWDYSDMEHPDEGCTTSIEPELFTGGAPRLKYLCYDGVGTGYGFPPTVNLTTLRIEGGQSEGTLTIGALLSLPLLENLSLDIPELMQEWPAKETPGFPLTMGRLKNLRLSNSQAEFQTLLPLLRAPLLEFVILMAFSLQEIQEIEDEEDEEASHSFPSVRDLILLKSPILHALESPLVRLFPNVQSLTIIGKEEIDANALVAWHSLRMVTIDAARKNTSPIAMDNNTARTSATLRIPQRRLEEWSVEGERTFERIEQLDNTELLVPHWPQNDPESCGFITIDGFYRYTSRYQIA